MPGLRVVIDNNVLVSGLAYPRSVQGRIVTAWRQGSQEVALSRYILGRVGQGATASASGSDDTCRSPGLGRQLTLLAAKADYLLTGDKELLALASQYNHPPGGILGTPQSLSGCCMEINLSVEKPCRIRSSEPKDEARDMAGQARR